MRQSFRAAVSVLAVGFATALGMTVAEAESCPNPRQMDGFKTCADVAKAEQEGEVVFYTTDPPQMISSGQFNPTGKILAWTPDPSLSPPTPPVRLAKKTAAVS